MGADVAALWVSIFLAVAAAVAAAAAIPAFRNLKKRLFTSAAGFLAVGVLFAVLGSAGGASAQSGPPPGATAPESGTASTGVPPTDTGGPSATTSVAVTTSAPLPPTEVVLPPLAFKIEPRGYTLGRQRSANSFAAYGNGALTFRYEAEFSRDLDRERECSITWTVTNIDTGELIESSTNTCLGSAESYLEVGRYRILGEVFHSASGQEASASLEVAVVAE